ncbi:MAG: rod shape-determining protein RodA, partial [Sediminibacterium sp.]|nr:rod shape-determining protein RodA [Sediminibacterium sp.]
SRTKYRFYFYFSWGSLWFNRLHPFFNNMLECYQSTRIYSLIGKDYDCSLNKKENKKSNVRKPDNYNVRQSKIAIGSGGLFGKGFLKGTQTKGKYVPEQSTDFIFTSLGEAFGLIGCTLFLIIYLVFLMRILKIAENQRSPFSRIYGYCVVGFLFFHFTINVAMTIGLFPIVGIPLPFISYGGSSLFTFTILFSILIKLNIDKHRILK